MESLFGIILEKDDYLLGECLVSFNNSNENPESIINAQQQQDWVFYPGYITKLVLKNFFDNFHLVKINANTLMISVLDVFLTFERKIREHTAKTLESLSLDKKIISYQE
jgi:hypothetical protein